MTLGLFDAFKKKQCDICGGEIGLLGNRKLEDGNLCKKCAAKLSPWFDDRRNSTVEEIKAQLAYREENQKAVENFRVTRTLGRSTKICFDEDARKFLISKTNDIIEENPDVLDYDQVTGCDLDIEERREEIMREVKRGDKVEKVSYNPPRYLYEYDFYMEIRVRHPYFSDMRFRLNPSSLEIEVTGNRGPVGKPGRPMLGAAPAVDPTRDVEYREYEAMGQEIKDLLSEVRENVREEIAAAAAPKTAVTCPNCGATTMPDSNGRCEYCGSAL